MTFYVPKTDLFTILSGIEVEGIDTITVYPKRPDGDMTLPCYLFKVVNNDPNFNLDKEITDQRIVAEIDIFGLTSGQTTSLLTALVEAMTANEYLLSFSGDVEDPDGYSHINTRFYFTY